MVLIQKQSSQAFSRPNALLSPMQNKPSLSSSSSHEIFGFLNKPQSPNQGPIKIICSAQKRGSRSLQKKFKHNTKYSRSSTTHTHGNQTQTATQEPKPSRQHTHARNTHSRIHSRCQQHTRTRNPQQPTQLTTQIIVNLQPVGSFAFSFHKFVDLGI